MEKRYNFLYSMNTFGLEEMEYFIYTYQVF